MWLSSRLLTDDKRSLPQTILLEQPAIMSFRIRNYHLILNPHWIIPTCQIKIHSCLEAIELWIKIHIKPVQHNNTRHAFPIPLSEVFLASLPCRPLLHIEPRTLSWSTDPYVEALHHLAVPETMVSTKICSETFQIHREQVFFSISCLGGCISFCASCSHERKPRVETLQLQDNQVSTKTSILPYMARGSSMLFHIPKFPRRTA